MRNHEDPDLAAYLEAERGYFDARCAPLDALAEDLAGELRGHIPDRETTPPWEQSGARFDWWTSPGNEFPALRRDGVVLLDVQAIADAVGATYAAVGVCEPSPDGRFVAWSLDVTGEEVYELRFREIGTGRDAPTMVQRTYYTGAWSSDGCHFFYTVPDDAYRPAEVRCVEVSTGRETTCLTEKDERFELTVRARGGWILITARSRDTTQVWSVPADTPLEPPTAVAERVRGVEYDVEPQGDGWLIVTNLHEVEFELMSAPSTSVSMAEWQSLRTPEASRAERLHEVIAFEGGHIACELRREGRALVRIMAADGSTVHELEPDDGVGTIRLGRNEDPGATYVTVVTESFIAPPQSWDVDLLTGQRRLRHRREVPGFNAGMYLGERVTAQAPDGRAVPVILVHRRDVDLGPQTPCLLWGYGSYEAVDDSWFDAALLPLLDRGVVFATAYLRGGGEVGRAQWLDGRLDRKRNTFIDHIAAAEALAIGVDARGPLVGPIVTRGLSAGGLLQGAVYAMRPDLWAGVVAEVPFVDVVNSMLDASLPLTVTEWDEWGDPREPAMLEYLRSYAPYENLPPAATRPPLLVTGAVHDPRVLVHEPAKWVAALRASDPNRGAGDSQDPAAPGTVLFRVETGAGSHVGQSGRYAAVVEAAQVTAWILRALAPR
jgi:oligopeptidase B